MKTKNCRSLSVSDVDNFKWEGEIPDGENSSGTIYRFYKLHSIPIGQIELHDIRFLIGQNAGLDCLVPIAIETLQEDIFIETEYYPGDLLSALFSVNKPGFWADHPKEKEAIVNLYEMQKDSMNAEDFCYDTRKKLKNAFNAFTEQK